MQIQAAIEHYHGLLEEYPAEARESADLLRERQPELHLMWGDRVMCGSLRPQLITASHYAQVQHVCGALAVMGNRLEHILLERPDLLDVLDLDDAERRLVRIEPGFK